MSRRLFTAESVTGSHRDAIADRTADTRIDALLRVNGSSRTARKTLTTVGPGRPHRPDGTPRTTGGPGSAVADDMLDRILPDGVAVVETFHDDSAAELELHPKEAWLIRHAVAARRQEFATVRRCAREALSRLGVPPVPILPDRHGAPRWPAAVIGSLTHCTGYRAAVVAPAADLRLLGIDAEPDAPLPRGVLESIALPSELRLVRHLLTRRPDVRWDRALFSMKEAVYKTWYPHTGQRLDFGDAELAFDAGTPVFTARLRVPGAPRLEGRWMANKGLLITAIAAA